MLKQELRRIMHVTRSGFDPEYGKEHFRAVFLPEETMLAEAFDAIESFMKPHA
jgi:aspartate/methionine/tyrosine aminotransferase